MKTEKEILKKITEVEGALRISENTHERIAWIWALNALNWVLEK